MRTLPLVSLFASIALFGSPALSQTLTGTIRDFCAPVGIPDACTAHPDFQRTISPENGIVEDMLGADGTPVYAKGDGSTSPTTTGAANFAAWYHDVAGVNASAPFDLTLDAAGGFRDLDFFPIDGQLFGNQDDSNNLYFTVELHGSVPFEGDEIFTAGSDDDLWIFVNGRLAIDLGGVHGFDERSVDFGLPGVQAQLGLVPGTPYDLDVFFAERFATGSSLEILTDGVFIPEPGTAGLLLAGLGGLAAGGSRRRSIGKSGDLR
jgi:fibro-slime domain-containing protein